MKQQTTFPIRVDAEIYKAILAEQKRLVKLNGMKVSMTAVLSYIVRKYLQTVTVGSDNENA